MTEPRRFRVRTPVVQAMKYTNPDDIISWMSDGGIHPRVDFYTEKDSFLLSMKLGIGTSDGVVWMSEGDWLVKDSNGWFYPCSADVFRELYGEEEHE